MIKAMSATLIALALLHSAAWADSLPEDVPVVYAQPAMDESAVAAPVQTPAPNEAPELDESAVPEGTKIQPDSFSVNLGGAQVRPGDAPRSNSFTIHTVSDIRFPSPFEPAIVNATNPEGSTVITQYALRVSIAELSRQIGRTGHTPEQMAALAREPGFDPATRYVTLAQTKGIAPGQMIQLMSLSPLPDGSMLGAGDYQAEMIVTAYDIATNRRSMLGSVVEVQLHIISDTAALQFDARGMGALQSFNPAAAGTQVRYEIQISQQALLDGSGSAHQPESVLAAQRADPAFDPAYVFITLYASEPVAPGEMLDAAVELAPLPDGQALPPGRYVAWLVRSTYDASLDLWQLLDARTQLDLTVGLPDIELAP